MGFSADNDSGRIWFDVDRVHYASQTYASWSVLAADIRVVGEMTNQDGPFADDYFLCFVTGTDGNWCAASFYADGRDACLEQLGTQLGAPLELRLSSSTDFASRILWPPSLAGMPLFAFRDQVPHGFWQRLRHRLVGQNVQTLSRPVMALLHAVDRRGIAYEYVAAHRHCSANRAAILASRMCGCFHCLKTFAAREVTGWIRELDGSETALCPHCHIDSVLGDAAGIPLTDQFLAHMKQIYF